MGSASLPGGARCRHLGVFSNVCLGTTSTLHPSPGPKCDEHASFMIAMFFRRTLHRVAVLPRGQVEIATGPTSPRATVITSPTLAISSRWLGVPVGTMMLCCHEWAEN